MKHYCDASENAIAFIRIKKAPAKGKVSTKLVPVFQKCKSFKVIEVIFPTSLFTAFAMSKRKSRFRIRDDHLFLLKEVINRLLLSHKFMDHLRWGIGEYNENY